MQNFLYTYTRSEIDRLIAHRKGEVKFGQRIRLLNEEQDLEEQFRETKAKYVLFGVPEDIGVMGNLGRKGTRYAWDAALKQLLNTQNHKGNKAKRVLLLGYLDFRKEMEELGSLDPSKDTFTAKARELTAKIDTEVTDLVRKVVQAGKKPIVVGGGHNNCYGILKGCALAVGKPLNCINVDAHTDFRNLEGRHSGNGFSYAFREGFLKRYFIFGLHENYTSKSVFKKMDELKDQVRYTTFEELLLPAENGFDYQTEQAFGFIKQDKYGIEIDCDAIQHVPSSAMSPSGFSTTQVRRLIHHWKNHKNVQYLHICEAAPDPENDSQCRAIGKLISYFITDFIRK